MTKKIHEWKDKDWIKGQSAYASIAVGGIFQSLSGCNPFEQGGLALPSLIPDTRTLATVPKTLTSFNSGGVKYIYSHTNTKLYQVLQDSPYTVTDVTAQINQHFAFGVAASHLGAIIYKSKYVYAHITSTGNGYISANTLPVASGSDVLIVSGLQSSIMDVVRFCVGADGNLYYTAGGFAIGEITSVTGTAGNSSLFYIDDGFFARDIINDGRYLVIIADNNVEPTASRLTGSYKTRVYYWDMVQTDGSGRIVPDAMFEITDSYAIGGKLTDKGIEFFGYNGLYVTNVATEPKMIRPFPATLSLMGRPINPYQIVFSKGSLYWIDGFSSARTDVYAYGNPTYGQQKIFYRPYNNQGVVTTGACILSIGDEIVVGCDQPALYFYNVSATRGNMTIITLDDSMVVPHSYDATKIVLSQPLSSGQSVQVIAITQNGTQMSSETKTYGATNPRQSLVFKRMPTSNNQPNRFEDIQLTISTVGAAVQRVSTYATPIDDLNETL